MSKIEDKSQKIEDGRWKVDRTEARDEGKEKIEDGRWTIYDGRYRR